MRNVFADVPDVGPGSAEGIGGSVRIGPGVAAHSKWSMHGVRDGETSAGDGSAAPQPATAMDRAAALIAASAFRAPVRVDVARSP
jgi:hypothetical protein